MIESEPCRAIQTEIRYSFPSSLILGLSFYFCYVLFYFILFYFFTYSFVYLFDFPRTKIRYLVVMCRLQMVHEDFGKDTEMNTNILWGRVCKTL